MNYLRDNCADFSIALFGRTMAGKSTLMEVLINGDGSTIGKGAQRTTRDIRSYEWNGLRITDVPGIGAFEGEDDEQIAFEVAKTADLILFLITDDAPQASEADCFYKIMQLGKPIICVMNVKASIPEGKSIRLIQRDIRKKFDEERLTVIHKQFLSYAEKYGQKWDYVPFIYVHLKAAYLAGKTLDVEMKNTLYHISRIDYLQKRIIEQVSTKGKFLRIKTFIDIISTPVLDSMENLLLYSQLNSAQGRTILAKKRQLDVWKSGFYRDGSKRIESLITRIKSELNSEIASFTEDHFSDKNADKAWDKVLNNRRIQEQSQELLGDLKNQVENNLSEVSREIANELKFTLSITSNKALKMKSIIDGKKIWSWGSTIVVGGLGISAGIASLIGAAVAGPLGWATIAVSGIGFIGSFLFKSREKKEYEARIRLEKKLRTHVNEACDSLQKQLQNNLDLLMQKRVDALMKEMDRINSTIFSLADIQRELAWGLNDNLLSLNNELVKEAIRLVGSEGLEYHIQSVARIPGNSNLFLLRDGTFFSIAEKNKLVSMMGERIFFVFDTDNKKILISRILGQKVSRQAINIEEKIGVAHINVENDDPEILNRVRLAQQFAKIQILKE